jgi:molecular chaperone GrpE (heat shock protein)
MTEAVIELEQILIQNLKSTNHFKNELERKENEKNDLRKDISISIIDILDSFERIEEWIIEKKYDKIDVISKTAGRYNTIQRKLLGLLKMQGVTKIEFPDNRLIVGLCEVLETASDINRNNDEIISIIRNGYIRGNELIRPAQIIVVKNS